jgi:hypothetical protein
MDLNKKDIIDWVDRSSYDELLKLCSFKEEDMSEDILTLVRLNYHKKNNISYNVQNNTTTLNDCIYKTYYFVQRKEGGNNNSNNTVE